MLVGFLTEAQKIELENYRRITATGSAGTKFVLHYGNLTHLPNEPRSSIYYSRSGECQCSLCRPDPRGVGCASCTEIASGHHELGRYGVPQAERNILVEDYYWEKLLAQYLMITANERAFREVSVLS